MSAGLSLGEYAALVDGGALRIEDAMAIVQKRGEYMQDLCPEGDWSMAAILGLENKEVEEACKKVTNGFAQPANYNCPKQVAISGDKDGVYQAMEIAKEMGAKRVVELKTSGPFHTKKLENASKALRKVLEDKEIKTPKTAVVKNIDARPYTAEDDMRDILAKHVMSPTRMSDTIKYMMDNGVDTFIEIGPGKTLSNFVTSVKKSLGKDVKIMNINDKESLESVIKQLEILRGEDR